MLPLCLASIFASIDSALVMYPVPILSSNVVHMSSCFWAYHGPCFLFLLVQRVERCSHVGRTNGCMYTLLDLHWFDVGGEAVFPSVVEADTTDEVGMLMPFRLIQR